MHKRTIALAAAALLFNGGAIAQTGSAQKQHRTAATDKRVEKSDKAETGKPA